MTLWEEACMTTLYVQNMSPHQILKNITPKEAFTRLKIDIGHFRIFGCPLHFHVPKEKRSKLDLSGRKGTFVGYNESLKEYHIYIPGKRQIEVRRDVIFEEEIAFQRSRESQMEIDIERVLSPPSTVQRETKLIPIDLVGPVDLVAPVDIPKDIVVGHKRLAWARQILQEAEGHVATQGTSRESKRPKRFLSYFSAISHIIDY
jgi:hypothetical protein